MMPMQLEPPAPSKYYGPFEARAKLMNLQNLAQERQEGAQRLETGRMVQDEHKRALAQTQAINQAYQDAFTVGDDGRPQLDEGKFSEALARGGHGVAIPGILEANTKYKKSLADLADTQGKVAALEQDAAGNLAASVRAGQNDPHLFLTHVTQAGHSGALTPAHAKALMDPVIAALDQDPTGDSARSLVGQLTYQMIQGSPKQQELATSRNTSDSTVQRNKAQARLANIGTQQKEMELAAQTMPDNDVDWQRWRQELPDYIQPNIPPHFSPAATAIVKRLGLTMDQQRQADQAKATLDETKKRDAANMGNSETELAVIATNPNETPERRAAAGAALKRLDQSKQASRPVVNNLIPGVPTAPAAGAAGQLHGEEYLKTLPPSFAAQIKGLAAGEPGVPTGRAATSGAGLQIMNALYQYDPEYSPLLAQQRKETLKEFTSTQVGHAGGQVMALNTLIHHADLYLDAVKALQNGTFKPGNLIYNKVASMFGAAPPTTAKLLAQFFASETGKVATGGVPAEGEIRGILENMSTDGSPEAMERAGRTLIGIAAGRMVPLKERRDKAKLEKFVDILGPDAKEVLARRGFDPETMKPRASGAGRIVVKTPDGKSHPFDTEAAAQNFEQLVKQAGGTTSR